MEVFYELVAQGPGASLMRLGSGRFGWNIDEGGDSTNGDDSETPRGGLHK